MKPDSLIELISNLKSMPGISKKQAEKITYYLVQSDNKIGNNLADAIKDANSKVKKCSVCNHMTEDEKCYICLDTTRQNIIVVVETPLDIFKFEESNNIRPKYHVLGGLIKVSQKTGVIDLNIESLKARAKNAKEIILALSPTLEGIVTANYIKETLKNSKVTQLAQGIPLGAAMEYVDELTLKAAWDNRKEME